jgi:hypothetical protein
MRRGAQERERQGRKPCGERRRRTPHEAELRSHQRQLAKGERNDVPGIEDVSEVDTIS